MVEKGLDANPVPGDKQSSVLFFPYRKRKDSIKMVHAVCPKLCIGVKDYFCIGMSKKLVSGGGQFPAQFLGIIQFSIIHQTIMLAGEVQFHRLSSADWVDDCKSCVQQCYILLLKKAGIIWASAMHGFQHCVNHRFLCRQSDDSGNCTHRNHIPSILLLYVCPKPECAYYWW